jgi:hypothetical protein
MQPVCAFPACRGVDFHAPQSLAQPAPKQHVSAWQLNVIIAGVNWRVMVVWSAIRHRCHRSLARD